MRFQENVQAKTKSFVGQAEEFEFLIFVRHRKPSDIFEDDQSISIISNISSVWSVGGQRLE